MMEATTLHATALDYDGQGILLRGASGSGKSSIAMVFLTDADRRHENVHLVADDRVILEPVAGNLRAHAPDKLKGLIEVRGLGILEVPFKAQTNIRLVVDLLPESALERYPPPETQHVSLEDLSIPRIAIAERNPDATAIIRFYLRHGPRFSGDIVV